MNFIKIKLTLVVAFINKFEDTFSCFCSIFILSLVNLSIEPLLNSISMLLIILPFPDIFSSILMGISSLTTGLIVYPLSLINISIRMIKCSFPIRLIVFPLPDIFATISPNLSSKTLSFALKPLALIGYSIVKLNLLKFD